MSTPSLPSMVSGFATPASNITPFTYRDGLTYLQRLERIVGYINNTVVPFVNENYTALAESFNIAVAEMNAKVDAAVQDMSDQVAAAEAAQAAAEAAVVAANAAAELAEQYASDAADVQDASITAIFNNASSQFRQAAEAAYPTQAEFNTLNATVTTGRLSVATLDTRFNAKAEDTDVTALENTVNTGRLSAATLDGRFDAIVDDSVSSVNSAYSSTKTLSLITPGTMTGTFAARPAANTVQNGTLYICTNVPEMYIAQGSTWLVTGSGGNELAAATSPEFTENSTANTYIDIPGMSVTFTVGMRPIEISYCMGALIFGAVGGCYIRVLLDNVLYADSTHSFQFASIWETISFTGHKRGLVPGSTHTVKLQQAPQGSYTLRTGWGNVPKILEVKTL